jgi:hypothetical protein
MEHIRIASSYRNKGTKTGRPLQDSLVLMAGMVSFRRALVKDAGEEENREYKGKTI